jgi:hypothetical protein
MDHLVVDPGPAGLDGRAIAADCSEGDAARTKNKDNHQEKFMPI